MEERVASPSWTISPATDRVWRGPSALAARKGRKRCVKADSPTPACLSQGCTSGPAVDDGWLRGSKGPRPSQGDLCFAAVTAEPCLSARQPPRASPRIEIKDIFYQEMSKRYLQCRTRADESFGNHRAVPAISPARLRSSRIAISKPELPPMAASVYAQVTDAILHQLDIADPASWICPWHRSAGGGLPTNAQTQRSYRGINILSLWCQARARGYAGDRWATYRQWPISGHRFVAARPVHSSSSIRTFPAFYRLKRADLSGVTAPATMWLGIAASWRRPRPSSTSHRSTTRRQKHRTPPTPSPTPSRLSRSSMPSSPGPVPASRSVAIVPRMCPRSTPY